ncbi:MAG: nucleotidyltransferase domain-containing protein [Colwellia sp.]
MTDNRQDELSLSELCITGLPSELIENLRTIFSGFSSIKQVKLYGSRAKGTFRHGSDIDLTFVGSINHDQLMDIDVLIDDLFTPYSFDLSILFEIDNAELLQHIERVGLVIYSSRTFSE